MFIFNLSDGSSHCYSDVDKAYAAYLKIWATEGDFNYYNFCCGDDLRDVTDPSIKESIFRNVFELVIHSYKTNEMTGVWG